MDAAALVREALRARESAYAPYSNFQVGAALITEDGQIFRGANVENASYGLTLCAERVAVVSAVSQGIRKFASLAIATEKGAAPCGACRQVLREFAPKLVVHLGDAEGNFTTTNLGALLPSSFGPDDL